MPMTSQSRVTNDDGRPTGGETRPAVTAIAAFLLGTREPDRQRVFWWAWSVQAVIVLCVTLLDVQMRLHQDAIGHLIDPLWRPLTDEFSSGVVIILLFAPLCRMAMAVPPAAGPIGRFLLLHGAGVLAFSIVHVAGFVAVRMVVYGLFGELYHFGGLGPFFYELSRDLFSYGLTVGGVWGANILLQSARQAAPRPERATFDIRDNAKVLRVPIEAIVAVRSAGNYVEFLLLDGRQPLMRTTLADMAGQLEAHGLVRTHRSWLVNSAHIAQIEPAGSGDFKLSLAGGVCAPLSRRFRGAVVAHS